jgi:hypothetical protein
MSKKEQKQYFYSKGTIFDETFETLYELVEHGDKQYLHEEIRQLTIPPISPITARKYCNNPGKIPKTQKSYFECIMSEILFRYIEKKKAKASDFLSKVEPLQKELQNIFTQKIKT